MHSAKQTLGKLPATAFGTVTLPRLPPGLIAGYRALGDLTGQCADAMDQLSIAGVVPGSTLQPTDPAARIVGQALTVKNIKVDVTVEQAVAGVAVQPGDLVIADEAGVCFIPFARAAGVLALAQKIGEAEAARLKLLQSGISISEFVNLAPSLQGKL